MLGAVGGGGMFTGIVAGAGSAVSGVLSIFAGLAAGVAAVTAPVWGVVAAVAAAVAGLALAIYNYWVPISNFVAGFASVIYDAVSSVVSTIAGFGARIASAVGSWAVDRIVDLAGLLGIDEATVRAAVDSALAVVSSFAASAISFIKSIPAAVTGWISDIFTMNTYSAEATAGFRKAGENAGKALVDAVKAAIDGLVSWFSSLPSRIIAAIGSIDIGSLIKWPSMPSWLGGNAPSGNANPDAGQAVSQTIDGMEKRAGGGPVNAGQTYLVGERGPELFSPGRSGFISPNEVYAGASTRKSSAQPSAARPEVRVSINAPITVHGITDLAAIGRHLRDQVNEAMSGIQADMEYAAGQ